MGVTRGQGSQGPPGFKKFQQKKVVFLVSRGKKQISLLLASTQKNFGKII